MLENVSFALKHWSFLVMTSILTLYLFEKLKSSGQKKYLFLLVLTLIVGMYSNLVYFIFLFTFGLYVFVSAKKKTITFSTSLTLLLTAVVFAIPLLSRYGKARRQLFEVQSSQVSTTVASMSAPEYVLEALSVLSGANYLPQFFAVCLVVTVLALIAISVTLDSKCLSTRILLSFRCCYSAFNHDDRIL